MKMEVKVNLDTVTWAKDSYTLEDLVKRFKTDMPDYLKVDEAYYLYEDEFYCDQGDYFKVHGIREELVYRAIAVTTFGLEIRSTPVHIPLRYKGKVKLVPPNAFGKVYNGLSSVARDLPKFIQVVELPDYGSVTERFSLENGDVLELFQINEPAMTGMSRTMTFQKVDGENFSEKIGHQFKLPVTRMGKFEYLRDPNQYTVMEIEEMQESLPGEKHVKFVEPESETASDINIFKGEFILQNTFLKRELVCTEVTNTVESIDLLAQQEDPRRGYRPDGVRNERLQLFVVDDSEMNATFNYYHLPRDVGNNKIDVGCLKSFIYFKVSAVNQYIPDHDYSYVSSFRTSNPEQQEGDKGPDFDYELVNDGKGPNESKDYDDVEPQDPFHLQQSVSVPDEHSDEGSDYEKINDEDLIDFSVPARPPKGMAAVGLSSKAKKKKKKIVPPPVETPQGKHDSGIKLPGKDFLHDVKGVLTSKLKKKPSKAPMDMSGSRRPPPPPVSDDSEDDTLYDDAEVSMPVPPVPKKCPELRESIKLERENSMKIQIKKTPLQVDSLDGASPTVRDKKVPPVPGKTLAKDEPSVSPRPVTAKFPISPPGAKGDISLLQSISNVKLKKVPATPSKKTGQDNTNKITRTASEESPITKLGVQGDISPRKSYLNVQLKKVPPTPSKKTGQDSTNKITRTASEESSISPPAVPIKSPKSAPPVCDKPKTKNEFFSESASKLPQNPDEPVPVAKPRFNRKSNVLIATIKPIGSVKPEDSQPTPQVGPHLLRSSKSNETLATTPKPILATKPLRDPPASEKVETNSSASLDSPIEDDLCKSTTRLSISFEKFEDIPTDVTGLTVKQLGEVLLIYGLAKVKELFLEYHIDGEFFMNEMSKDDLEEDPFNLKGFSLARLMTIKSKKKPM